jgi:hypothetical protein
VVESKEQNEMDGDGSKGDGVDKSFSDANGVASVKSRTLEVVVRPLVL